jgi:hypothetical protein
MEYAPSPPYHPSLSGKLGRHLTDSLWKSQAPAGTGESEKTRRPASSKASRTSFFTASPGLMNRLDIMGIHFSMREMFR